MDLARSVQEVTEEAMLRMARHVHRETGEKNLCLAGGVTFKLRGQLAALARRTIRKYLDSTGCGRCRRGIGSSSLGLVSVSLKST